MENNLIETIEEAIRTRFPEALEDSFDVCGILNLRIKASALKDVCAYLFEDKKFDYLADITAIDWTDRIELVYHLTALYENIKLALRVNLDRSDPKILTLTDIWKGAEFQEREVFDLMGVIFENHPDLRRILLPEDWEGYPLRKDYVNPD